MATTITCSICGLLVGDSEVHRKWHRVPVLFKLVEENVAE